MRPFRCLCPLLFSAVLTAVSFPSLWLGGGWAAEPAAEAPPVAADESPQKKVESLHTAAEARQYATRCLESMQEAARAEQFDRAMDFARAAYAAAGKTRDAKLVENVVARGRQVLATQKESQQLQPARAKLSQDPHDPQANRLVGRYWCFTQGDWSRGLPLLAQSDDPVWKSLAAEELTHPAQSAAQGKLAEAYWRAAEGKSDPDRKALLDRAAHWYRKALPGLTGLARTKANQRLAIIKAGEHSPQAVAAGQPASEFPLGQWIDLLPRVRPDRDALQGTWRLAEGKLEAAAQADAAACLAMSVAPQGSYDLAIRFVRSGDGPIAVPLPVGGRMCALALGYGHGSNGLDIIDGRRANDNASTFQAALNDGRPYKLEIAVRVDGSEAAITVTLDGRPLVFYRGPLTALTLADDWKFPKQSLGLVVRSSAVFDTLRFKRVSGDVRAEH